MKPQADTVRLTPATCYDSGRLVLCSQILNWVPEQFRFGSWNWCLYCGIEPSTSDHVIPQSILPWGMENGGGSAPGITAPCCKQCNCLLGSLVFDTLSERCDYVRQRLTAKLKRWTRMLKWTDRELKPMGHSLKHFIIDNMEIKQVSLARLAWQSGPRFLELLSDARAMAVKDFPSNKELHRFMGCPPSKEI
jgi:hypothetical protein